MKILAGLGEEVRKERIKALKKLVDYPLSLRGLDVEKLEGAERTFRFWIGRYRLIFHVDKNEGTVFVTHLGEREPTYEI